MYVQQLTLNNVRRFRSDLFTFQPGFNLLVGENGEGKTTILRSLLAVLGSTAQKGRRTGLTDQDVALGAKALQITAEAVDPQSNAKIGLRYEKALKKTAHRSRAKADTLVL